jgi:hypothetical protein
MTPDRDDVTLWERELTDHVYDDPRLGMIARGEIPPADPVSRRMRRTETILLFIAVTLIGVGMLVGSVGLPL